MEKIFLATWGQSYINPCEQKVTIDFFNDSKGYDVYDRDEINHLEIGEHCLLDAGDHLVKRIA